MGDLPASRAGFYGDFGWPGAFPASWVMMLDWERRWGNNRHALHNSKLIVVVENYTRLIDTLIWALLPALMIKCLKQTTRSRERSVAGSVERMQPALALL